MGVHTSKDTLGTCARHLVMAQMCSAPKKYPYFDSSNTSKQEHCYIPKEDFFLGHPVQRLISLGSLIILITTSTAKSVLPLTYTQILLTVFKGLFTAALNIGLLNRCQLWLFLELAIVFQHSIKMRVVNYGFNFMDKQMLLVREDYSVRVELKY